MQYFPTVRDLHRKQVHVSSVPGHCVHQYIDSNWRWTETRSRVVVLQLSAVTMFEEVR